MSDIVKYNNDLNTVSFGKFKEKELDLFFSLCFKAKEQGTNIIKIDFSELKSLSAYQNRNLKRFTEDLESIYDKLLSLKMTERHSELSFTKFNLFNEYTVNAEERTITIQVHEKFKNYLNNLLDKYTKFELENLVALRSSYSKNMFRLLKQWESKKEKEFSLDELRNLLDIPVKYDNYKIRIKILDPIKKELSNFFPNLEVKPIKKERTIIAYKFIWRTGEANNEVIDYIEDDTKEIEISSNTSKRIKEICNHNRFIKKVLDDEENLISLIEKFVGKEEALIKGLEYASKKIASLSLKNNNLNINLEYLIKAVRTGAGIKRVKKVLKIVQDDVIDVTAEDIKDDNIRQTTFDELPIEEKEDEKIDNNLSEFNKLSDEEKSKIEKTALELLIKELGKDGNYIRGMKNTSPTMYYNALKKYIIQAMNGEEVEVDEQSIQVKEEKKVYTADDIPAEKLLGKNGKKLVGGALQMRIKKILKEMNGE